MSGIIEFYKIDKSKIEKNFLPLMSSEKILETLREIVFAHNLHTEYDKVLYEDILIKIKSDFFKINHTEFQLILDWITSCFSEEFESSLDFLGNLGLVEIGYLHSREESAIFYAFGAYGLNDFNGSSSSDFKIVLDFLILTLSKIILKEKEIDTDYKDEVEAIVSFLSKKEDLNLKTNEFLDNISSENDFENLYINEKQYMFECCEGLLSKMKFFKENIIDYNGVVYRRDLF
ncbi:hypothetical protein [Flavobacterium gelatinilyticum]|uniref:hypothetical protein n=1 Tax=Flavobacterium gelatinilyticum TaxID=3003260 RepID=UPI002480C813|nr:hypothetical protein [Flavobacterium gelatinilyticum]